MSAQLQENTTNSPVDPDVLKTRWDELQAQEPKMRIRDAAQKLGASEAALVALGCGTTATRLKGSYNELFKRFPKLGEIMALTRNESVVHERRGAYLDVQVDAPVGVVLGPDIDLRLFFAHFKNAFAIEEPHRDGVRRSIQLFDADGTAVHKVYVEDEAGVEAFKAIVEEFRSEDQSRAQAIWPVAAKAAELPDEEIDAASLNSAWAAMKDTHEFHPLLRRHKVSRTQAFRLVGDDFARKISNAATRALLEKAAETTLPIMVFVGNPACIQIHSGEVKNIKVFGPWLNVLDRQFNLHLREDHVSETWVVRKPTRDGIITSVELYDEAGENLALFFGVRESNTPEDEAWRALVASLEALS